MQRTMTNMLLASAGFACFLALNSFSLWGFALLPETALGAQADLLWSAPLSLGNALAFVVFLAGSYWMPRVFSRDPLVAGIVLLTAAIALMGAYTASHNPLLLIVAGACMGVGTTCCFFCWARVFFSDGVELAKTEIVLGSVLSAVPYLAFMTLEPSAITVTLALLALFNVVALFLHGRSVQREESSAVPQRIVPFRTLLAHCWKALLCVAMIGFAAPIIATLSHESMGGLSFVQQSLMVHSENIIAALILGVVWLGFKREVSLTKAFTVLFPIITTALLLYFVLDPTQRIVVPYVSGIAFVAFSMIVMIESIRTSKRDDISLTCTYGLFAGLFYCANRAGNYAISGIDEHILFQETSVMITMFGLLYGCSIVMFFITRKPRDIKLEAAAQQADAAKSCHEAAEQEKVYPAPIVDPIDNNCHALANQYGLSQRQTDVLVLLARGYDIPTIATKLFVSENTVRTHTKKIYATLGVHSKREIIDLATHREQPQTDRGQGSTSGV